jgi:Na+/proline symporter/signal transduction histidine kinase
MSNYVLILIIIIYLALLFAIAFLAEKKQKSKWVNNPYIYVLSLGVYCTAWTYYGSIGVASKSGISFLAIYLGPVIAMPLWILIMRKVIRISKQQKISSIADFISKRYGNSRLLGALVTLTCLFGVIPYIALQLKAVSETFQLMTEGNNYISPGFLGDSTFYIAVLIAVFVAFYGTRSSDASIHNKGIIATVAFESALKLVFFLVIGIYVCFYLFEGTEDIYLKASKLPDFKELVGIGNIENGFNWLFTICLSFFAIFLLPRQFHVAVIENEDEKHIKKAIWAFPLYLLLFNFFVIFIAWAGNINLSANVNHDYYSLLLPLQTDNFFLASLVFVGGFSAVISMIIISTLALSVMLSNNVVIPYGFIKKMVAGSPVENVRRIKNIRRTAIFSLIIIAYLFYSNFSRQLSLFSIGLISFIIISQLAPSFFLGLFWRRGTAKAAKISIVLGLVVVIYTLVFPVIAEEFNPATSLIANGPFEMYWLKPTQLFGVDYLTPESNAFLWSMSINFFSFISISVASKGNYRERNYAEMFVNYESYQNLQENAFVWKGEAYVADIKHLLYRFLGKLRTDRAMDVFYIKYNISKKDEKADARLINFSEKLLTGSLGSASAKILLSSVSEETPISLPEVLNILEETKETKATNKLLIQQSEKLSVMAKNLRLANEELRSQDKMKDEFLDTVAHELKTPVTSIKATSEVLQDKDMPYELRKKFLDNIENDAERLATLIHNILDLEKLSNDRAILDIKKTNVIATIEKSIQGITQIAAKNKIQIQFKEHDIAIAAYDEDRILQVLTNLLSNALKFTTAGKGIIAIFINEEAHNVSVIIEDNGKGIAEEDQKYIFDKFYQSKNQNTKKPVGSGFGLAISKKIIESHGGAIWIDSSFTKGARFVFTLPKEI